MGEGSRSCGGGSVLLSVGRAAGVCIWRRAMAAAGGQAGRAGGGGGGAGLAGSVAEACCGSVACVGGAGFRGRAAGGASGMQHARRSALPSQVSRRIRRACANRR